MSGHHLESVRRITISKRSPVADLLGQSPMKDAPEPIFKALAEQFPAHVIASSRIELERPASDPSLEKLMTAAIALGLTPPRHRADSPAQIVIWDYRAYSDAEIDAAPLLECEGHQSFIGSVEFDLQAGNIGLRIARDPYLKRCKTRQFGPIQNLYHLLCVRSEAKRKLETAALQGLQLLPLPTNAPSGAWPDGIEPLHLLWSDHVMPEVDSDLFDNRGEVFRPSQRDFTNLSSECYLLDGHDGSPPLRYKGLGPAEFDVAITRERFGGKQPCYHKVVYSQKARTVLESINAELLFKPVLIGDEPV